MKRTSGWKPRRTKASAGHSSARPPTRAGSRSPTSIATRPPIELPTMCARSISSASMTPSTERAKKRAS